MQEAMGFRPGQKKEYHLACDALLEKAKVAVGCGTSFRNMFTLKHLDWPDPDSLTPQQQQHEDEGKGKGEQGEENEDENELPTTLTNTLRETFRTA